MLWNSELQGFINAMWCIYSTSAIFILQHEPESPGELFKAEMTGSPSRDFVSIDLGWGLRISMINKFSDAAAAAAQAIQHPKRGLGSTL